MPRSLTEFEIIERYFAPLSGREALGLLDDAACLSPPAGFDLVVTKDMLAAGVHFLPEDDPADIAWKALAVNLSDLSAKGAKPWIYFLGLGLSGREDDQWIADFAKGLEQAQQAFHITLGGGDTISTKAGLCVSVTALGLVPAGQMMKRGGAQLGDAIYVSGDLGEAALGLQQMMAASYPDTGAFIKAYRRPQPRVTLGSALLPLVTACADISDGLLADLGHISKASSLGADLYLNHIPVSDAALSFVKDERKFRQLAATYGDDYELVFTMPEGKEGELFTLSKDLGIKITRVGDITGGDEIRLLDQNGRVIPVEHKGYRHH